MASSRPLPPNPRGGDRRGASRLTQRPSSPLWYGLALLLLLGIAQAYYMTPRDGSPVVFGGLWSVWGTTDDKVLTCSIVTTAAVGELCDVHDRMPLLLASERWHAWLTATTALEALLAPPSAEQVAALEIRPVGPAVGDVRNDGPRLVERLPGVPPSGAGRHAGPPDPVDLTLF